MTHDVLAGRDHFVSLRLSPALWEALEKVRLEIERASPGMRVSLADACRVTFARALGISEPDPVGKEPPRRAKLRRKEHP